MAKKDIEYKVEKQYLDSQKKKLDELAKEKRDNVIKLMKKVNIGPCQQLMNSFNKYIGKKWGDKDLKKLEIDNEFYDEWKKFYNSKELKSLGQEYEPFFGKWENTMKYVTKENTEGKTTLLDEYDLAMLRNMIIHKRLELQEVIDMYI